MNIIYNEDCLITMDRAELQNKVDIVITSPPYNMTPRVGGWEDTSNKYDKYKDWLSQEDYLEFIVNVFKGYDKVLKKDGCILFNFSYSIKNPSLPYHLVSEICKNTTFDMADTIVWKKENAVPLNTTKNRLTRICEFIYVFARKDEMTSFNAYRDYKIGINGQKYYKTFENYIEAKNNDGFNTLNKSTFSTELVTKLLGIYGSPGLLVYDSFMGIGTTAKSCIINGMNYVGSEISKDQIEYFHNRL